MTTQRFIEPGQVVHPAAAILASLEYIDQGAAQRLGSLAEAVANAFMVVYYQPETGRATRNDFCEALKAIRRSLPQA